MYFLCVLFPIYIYKYLSHLFWRYLFGPKFRAAWSRPSLRRLPPGVEPEPRHAALSVASRAAFRGLRGVGHGAVAVTGPVGTGPRQKRGNNWENKGKHGKTWENTKYNPKFLKKNRRKHAENPRIHLWIIICPIAIGSFSPMFRHTLMKVAESTMLWMDSFFWHQR